MSNFIKDIIKNANEQIKYKNTVTTGEITVDNGDGTYDVKITNASSAYPNVETINYDAVFSVGEIVDIIFEQGCKESPKIIGHSKKIKQEPKQVEVDYSGGCAGMQTITTVTTLDAYEKTATSAYLEGEIKLNGMSNCTIRGFKYGLTSAYGSDIHEDGDYGTGYFNKQITELDPETTYHFQAYVLDANGDEQVGEDKTLLTSVPDIDIGVWADMTGAISATHTYINLGNPANASGNITSVKIGSSHTMYDVRVGIFYRPNPVEFPNKYSTRSYVIIGTVIGTQTIAVNLDVEIGDLIGIYRSDGQMDYQNSGYNGTLWGTYNKIPCTDETLYLDDADAAICLYGIG